MNMNIKNKRQSKERHQSSGKATSSEGWHQQYQNQWKWLNKETDDINRPIVRYTMALKLTTSSGLPIIAKSTKCSICHKQASEFYLKIKVSGVSYEEYQQNSNTDKIIYKTKIRINRGLIVSSSTIGVTLKLQMLNAHQFTRYTYLKNKQDISFR